MDEKYIEDLYNQLGGKDKFGSYESFSNLISSDDSYIKDFHNAFGEQTLGSFDSFSKLVKKKRRIRFYFSRGSYGWEYTGHGRRWLIGAFRSRG